MTLDRATCGTALVTSAAPRIGLRIAARLIEAGYAVVLHASPHARASVEAESAHLGPRAHVAPADLADASACERLVAAARAVIGPLSLLVNSGALIEGGDIGASDVETLDLALWDRHFSIDFRAPVILARAFATQTARGHDAAIVNIIDRRVLRPMPQFFSYTLTQAALWTATHTMAQAFAKQGVRVNAIGPRSMRPPADDGDESLKNEVVPLHRAVEPDDIATAVLYLASARAVTGQMIAVDAGPHLGRRTPDVVD